MEGCNGMKAAGGQDSPRPSLRVKTLVNYDDKAYMAELENDIANGVAHVQSSGLDELEERVQDLGDSWETASFMEDLVVSTEDESKMFFDVPDACTYDEVVRYRQLLRAVGPKELCARTVDVGVMTAKKLLTAFGIQPPHCLEGCDDDAYYGLLSLGMSRELCKRPKIFRYNSVDDAVELIQKSQNIIVLTGAGISTSLGIPDFRSKGTGLYSKLAYLGLSDPQEVFDIHLFRHDPSIFFSVAKDILPNHDRYTPTHAFIALLQDMGKLLTNYSQNIDNLEAKAGIVPEKLVQCHGSFATATCQKCGDKVAGEAIFGEIRAGKIPRCRQGGKGNRTTNNSRKRKMAKDGTDKKARRKPRDYDDSNSDSEYDVPGGLCGVMKPDITFFGEQLPTQFSDRLVHHDRSRVDLVIVMGTSLKVAPVSEMVPFMPPHVPQIYISREPVAHTNFDIDLLGDCDVVVSELCRRGGWDLKQDMIPKDQVVLVETREGHPSRHTFTQVFPKPEVKVVAEPEPKPKAKAMAKPKAATVKPKAKPAKSKAQLKAVEEEEEEEEEEEGEGSDE